jgi:arylsulfatase
MTFAWQKELSVVAPDARLTERSAGIPAYDTLSADAKRVAAPLMETYAGCAEHTGAQVGRLVETLTSACSTTRPSFTI